MIYFCVVKRIYLHRAEKVVLRWVALGGKRCPAEFPLHAYNAAVRMLSAKGMVEGDASALRLTDFGRLYLAENWLLRNPMI